MEANGRVTRRRGRGPANRRRAGGGIRRRGADRRGAGGAVAVKTACLFGCGRARATSPDVRDGAPRQGRRAIGGRRRSARTAPDRPDRGRDIRGARSPRHRAAGRRRLADRSRRRSGGAGHALHAEDRGWRRHLHPERRDASRRLRTSPGACSPDRMSTRRSCTSAPCRRSRRKPRTSSGSRARSSSAPANGTPTTSSSGCGRWNDTGPQGLHSWSFRRSSG